MYTVNRTLSLDELYANIKQYLPADIKELSEIFGVSSKELTSEFRKQLNRLKALGLIKRRNGTISLPSKEPEGVAMIVRAVNHEGKIFAVPIEWDEENYGARPEFKIPPEKHGQKIVRINDVIIVELDENNDFKILKLHQYNEDVSNYYDTKENNKTKGKNKNNKNGNNKNGNDGKKEINEIHKPRLTAKERDIKKIVSRFKDVSEPVPAVIISENGKIYAKSVSDSVKENILLDSNEHKEGSIVIVQRDTQLPNNGKIIENIGHLEDEAAFSIMSAVEMGIPIKFPDNIMEGSPAIIVPQTDEIRKDFTHIDFFTIDPEDARDYDDAIYVKADDSFHNPQGWLLYVAIADVSHYVRPRTILDDEALNRGNTTYMPDTTFPMIPKILSNNICSLVEGEERAAMIAAIRISKEGEIIDYSFDTGIIRSRARLSYEQVTEALEGNPDDITAPIFDNLIKPAHDLYKILKQVREKRNALEIDIEESRAYVDRNSQIVIKANARDDAHCMIEEMMIATNIVASKTINDCNGPVIRRIHGQPDTETLKILFNKLSGYGVSISSNTLPLEQKIAMILKETMKHPQKDAIHSEILRAQQRAIYSTEELGHFALDIPADNGYSHFTSPIRRGADLLVHRAIKYKLALGDIGIDNESYFENIQEYLTHLNMCERRSELAEDRANKRLVAKWMENNIGNDFEAVVTTSVKTGITFRVKQKDDNGNQICVHGVLSNSEINNKRGSKLISGDRIYVKATNADPISGNIKFVMS